jgi:hypothetical protein
VKIRMAIGATPLVRAEPSGVRVLGFTYAKNLLPGTILSRPKAYSRRVPAACMARQHTKIAVSTIRRKRLVTQCGKWASKMKAMALVP